MHGVTRASLPVHDLDITMSGHRAGGELGRPYTMVLGGGDGGEGARLAGTL